MPKRPLSVVWPALLCGLTLSACAPTLNLGNVIDTSSPSRAGPLLVGQTWAVSGQLASQSVSKTLSVPRLVEVQNGKGTLSVADQVNAAQVQSGEYQYTSYTNSDQLKKTRFVWNVAAAGGGVDQYECLVLNSESLPLTGVLTLQRQNDSNVQRGTCTATPTDPPTPPTTP
ncbi:hypothetical protein [Deinococcus rubellus]|uniref:Uncharacterized protein n=1 Tax=Deinococcus rubellus TaxID=1889240 RepID=A0ABY5YDK4_9DEIO|nr:hypothetical protein [Deinococcus rubellus]UWX62920.1 hypothetical protein N0D28_09080 [Deinococcus rubellus]